VKDVLQFESLYNEPCMRADSPDEVHQNSKRKRKKINHKGFKKVNDALSSATRNLTELYV
jgi:hypothetical protein